MSYGIGAPIDQRVNAYMGNPKALEKKYAETKDIYDLIALNQITEKQESAANAMRLAAANKGEAPTIYAKKEAQALDNAKKEVIDEQAGVMQNKMKQMQDAQKKVLQAAGAPPMPGQSTPQPQEPPAAGLAGLAAPNIQGMAGGGIVAFDQGGQAGEEEARRAMEERRQRQAAPPPQTQPTQQAQGGMQAGLARLLGIDPEAIYQRRNDEAARAANYNAEERAGYARQAEEKRTAYDQNKLNRMLLGMGGYSTNYGAIQGGGATAVNDEDNFMRERQRDERKLIDMGPASRMAGMKAGETAYGHGMTGLYHGVDAAARMAATGESAAGRAEAASLRAEAAAEELLRRKLVNTKEAAYKHPLVVAIMKEITENKQGIDHPENVKKLADADAIMRQIYKAGGFNPDEFVPPPVAAVPVPPKPPGMFSSRPPVDTNNPLLRGK